MIKRLVSYLSLLLVTACGAAKPPVVTPFPVWSLNVHVVMGDDSPVPIPLTIQILDKAPNPNAGGVWKTNENGDIGLSLKQSGFTICAEPPTSQYVEACAGVTLTDNQQITLTLKSLTPPSQPIHLDGTILRTEDNIPWHARAVTAFDLLATDQVTFLDWAKSVGFNSVRVLTTASITANLPPSLGEQRIASLCQNLRMRQMGAEFVLLADTGAQGLTDDQIKTHVHASSVQIKDNCSDLPVTIELANENAHPSQSKRLQDVTFLQSLYAIVKQELPDVPVSLGSTCCGQPDTVPAYGTSADYITLHLDRSRTPFWDEVRRVKDLIDTKNQTRQLIFDDEPMGAGEIDEAGRRSTNVTRFFVQGVLDRFGELGSTFHCDSCVSATVPGPIQQACARAYIAGATIVPREEVYQFYNDSIGASATNGADWSNVQKLFTFLSTTGGPSYVVALNVTGPMNIKWVNGWSQIGQLDTSAYPGIQILQIGK